ncbi:hypothetical protein JW851_03080 [Candidatus Woesearchaeota archaeon]|nr:hypothetical protein [Candidatus Woesearchaeota archaeon]
MKRKNVVIGVICAMILIAVIFALVSLFSGKYTAKPLILNTINLRANFDNPVARAEAITEINKIVADLNDAGINEGWRAMAACIPETCSDDEYMNFILSAVNNRPKDIEYSEIIKELVKVHRFWGDSTNVIVFSQSLTNTNNLVNELHFSTAVNAWNRIVECNGECEDYDNLFFDLIKIIVEL